MVNLQQQDSPTLRAARAALEQSLAIWRRIGDQGNLAQTLLALADVLLTCADLEPARNAIPRRLRLPTRPKSRR